MKKKIIVHQEKFPIVLFFAAIWVVFMGLYDPIFDSALLTTICLSILFTLIYFSLYSIEIIITEKYIKRGNRVPFRKKRSNEIYIEREKFQGLILRQNEKKYFEICAIDEDGGSIVLAMLPNKQPALVQQKKFEKEIHTYWKMDALAE